VFGPLFVSNITKTYFVYNTGLASLYAKLYKFPACLGFVIIVGLLEKALFYAEYDNMNNTGRSLEGLIEAAELVSCLKRTVAHVLVIIVACGYGVVKPRLGNTLNQVLMVGCLYFLLCAIEGLTRVSMVCRKVVIIVIPCFSAPPSP
jgi:hypothetical protein